MLISPGIGSGIELRVYDKLDPSQLIDILSNRIDPQYLEERRGPGGGSFRVRINDPKLTESPSLLEARNVVQIRVKNKVVGSWIIQRVNNKLIGAGEYAEQVYEISGPGIREWLKDAIVYSVNGISSIGGSRNYNFASVRGTWYNPAEWVAPVSMNRKDAGKPLSAITVAQAMRPGVTDDAPTKSLDGYPKAKGGWKNGYQLYGSTVPVKSGWGWINAGDSDYWWDANGWHVFTASNSGDPPDVTPEGGTRYPTAVKPGIIVYGYVNPLTGSWTDVGLNAAATEAIKTIKRTYWSPHANALRQTSSDPELTYATTQSVKEPSPPGHTDNNPWIGAPIDWPDAPHARWIWDRDTRFAVSGQRAPIGDVYFRREFTVTAKSNYSLFIAADNEFVVYVDAQAVAASTKSQDAATRTTRVDMVLDVGPHIIAVKATNWEIGAAGLLVALLQAGDADTPSSAVPVLVSGDSGWVCQGYPAVPPGWSVGEVLRTLVTEASMRGVNSMARLSLSFTDQADSEGVPWGSPIDWAFDLGSDYADVAAKIEELSAELVVRTNQDGTFTLDAFLDRGTDKSLPTPPAYVAGDYLNITRSIAIGGDGWYAGSNSVDGGSNTGWIFTDAPDVAESDYSDEGIVILRPGLNVADATEDGEFLIKNNLLVSSDEGWFESTDLVNSVRDYGRIEGFVSVSGTKSLAQAVAKATFDKTALPLTSTSVAFLPTEDTVPWVDFFLADWVLGPTKDKGLQRRRVMSIALSEQDNGAALYACEFDTISKDRIEKIERWLKSSADGTLGGTVANATGGSSSVTVPTSSISGSLSYIPFSNTDLVEQIIDGANIIDGSLVAADKMVANTITVELLQTDVLTATNIRSGTLIADIVMAGVLRTTADDSPDWPARAEMNATGFHAFAADGTETFTADLFGNVQLLGTIESLNYVAGVSGWRLLNSGIAEINELTARGTMQSSNYVAGTSGWRILSTGDVEFYSADIRGDFNTGAVGTPRIEIAFTGTPDRPQVNLWSGHVDEVFGASIQNISNAGNVPQLSLYASQHSTGDWGAVGIELLVPGDASSLLGAASGCGQITLGTGSTMAIVHLPITTYLESFEMRALDVLDGGTRTTASATYVFPTGSLAEITFQYPPSGTVIVDLSTRLSLANTDSTDAALLSFEIRDDNASGTVRFAASDNNACVVRGTAAGVPFPASRHRVADGLPTSGTGYIRALLQTTDVTNTASCQQTLLAICPSL